MIPPHRSNVPSHRFGSASSLACGALVALGAVFACGGPGVSEGEPLAELELAATGRTQVASASTRPPIARRPPALAPPVTVAEAARLTPATIEAASHVRVAAVANDAKARLVNTKVSLALREGGLGAAGDLVFTEVRIGLNDSSDPSMNPYLEYQELPATSTLGARRIRWRTTAPEARCGVLQVSATPFIAARRWNDTSALLAERLDCTAPTASGHRFFSFDFGHLEQSPPFSHKSGVLAPGPVPVGVGNVAYPFVTGHYFVRVVPVKTGVVLRAQGKPSAAAHIFYKAKPPPPVTIYPTHPKVRLAGVSGMRPDDFHFYCHYRVTANGFMAQYGFQPGDEINVCQTDDGGLLDGIADAIGGVVDAVRGLVDWVANLYNSAKAKLIELVGDLVGCGSNPTCRGIIKGLVDAGLTSLGLPPTLPNSDALIGMGKDYLTELIANETGLPADLIEAGMGKLDDALRQQRSQAEAGLFFVMDEARQYRPLTIQLRLERSTMYQASPSGTTLTVRDQSGLYEPVVVHLPPNKDGEGGSYTVPLFLQPREDFRRWLAMHQQAIDSLGRMDFRGYAELEQAAMAEYARFYLRFVREGAQLTVTTSDASFSAIDQLRLTCSATSCGQQVLKDW